MPDHIHILLGIRPNQSISDLVKMIKQYSSKWIKQQELARNFSWQSGYGAFSHSKKDLPTIINYINRQEDHHRIRSFREEYLELLEEAGIDFDHRYLFEPVL
jgi:REP element-mobilizing transposase RayT